MAISLCRDLSAPPKDVFKANAVNSGGVLWFQPFHCTWPPWLSSAFLVRKVYHCRSQVWINTAVSVNICMCILTRMSKQVHAWTTHTLHAIYWLWIFNRYCTCMCTCVCGCSGVLACTYHLHGQPRVLICMCLRQKRPLSNPYLTVTVHSQPCCQCLHVL